MLAAPMDDDTNLHCLIEIPKGSRNKYEWDPDLQAIKLNRFLFSSVHYPTDYGFITDTIGPHGDALDALVCVSAATFPGCLIEVRPVGVLRMTDEEGQSDKLVCVPTDDPDWEKVEELEDMSSQLRSEIEHFYSMYKEPEGKHVDVQGWDDAAAAASAIEKGREAYRERNS